MRVRYASSQQREPELRNFEKYPQQCIISLCETHTHTSTHLLSASVSESARTSAGESERVNRRPFFWRQQYHTQPDLGSLAVSQPGNLATLQPCITARPQLVQFSILHPHPSLSSSVPSSSRSQSSTSAARRQPSSTPRRTHASRIASIAPWCICAPHSIHTAHHQRTTSARSHTCHLSLALDRFHPHPLPYFHLPSNPATHTTLAIATTIVS